MSQSSVGNVVSFRGKTSNETLDRILNDLSRKVIIPASLPVPLQKKIFRTRWKTKLDLEPIEIEVDGKPFKFRHIAAVPNSRKSLFAAMAAMQTKQDWEKLPKLLEALWFHAARKFPDGDWPRIIRAAGAAGSLGPIFEAARKPARTGLRLARHETAQEFMSAIAWQVAGARWAADAAARGARDAGKVIAFLQDKDHQLSGLARTEADKKGMHPLKRDPQMMAHPVVFAAAMVARHGRRDEFLPVLRKYGELMLERWPENTGLLGLHPHAAYVDPDGVEYMMEKGKFLVVASPILKGFDFAIEALGDDPMGAAIKSRRDVVAAEVESALAATDKKNRRGQEMYDRVFKAPQLDAPAQAKEAKEETSAKA